MTRVLAFASVLLGVFSLVGCKSLGPIWSVRVVNYEPTAGEVRVRVCMGALITSVVVGTRVDVTVSAEPGGTVREEARPEQGLRVGDPVLLEATCTDEGGLEVGFARVEGRVSRPHHTFHIGSTVVYPPAVSGSGFVYADCLAPTVVRGQPPCIVERLVIPN